MQISASFFSQNRKT